jgi:hypothetical protein
MSPVDKAKRTLTVVEIPRDELALRIAQGCIGMVPPIGISATKVLDDMDKIPTMHGGPMMGEGFRRAADHAVRYFHQCVAKGTQPS